MGMTTNRLSTPRKAALRLRLLLLLSAGLLAAGCLPRDATFDLGISTGRIDGNIDMAALDETLGPPLVVSIKHHHRYSGYREDEQPITHPTAHVVRVARDGRFTVSMPSDVVSIEVMVLLPGFLTRSYTFKRSLGLGNITIRPSITRQPEWRSHFYTYIQPQVQHLIVEARYQLADAEQQQLATWLTDQQRRLQAGRNAPAAE